MVAVAVLVAQALWRGYLLSRGYFSQDDFLIMSAVHDAGWSDRLTTEVAGGFAPGASMLAWLCVSLAPLNWTLAAAVVLLLQTAGAAMMWVVLTRLLPDRWLRVPLLVLFAFGTQALWSTQWWVLGLEFWPATVLLLVSVWALVRSIQEHDPGPRLAAVTVLGVGGALLFDERAVLYPVVLAGIALVVTAEPTVRARATRTLREQMWVWAGLMGVVAVYAVVRWRVAPLGGHLGNELGDVVTTYLRMGLSEVFAGPWTGDLLAHAYLVPRSWAVGLNGALLLALIGATLQRGGPAARAAWGTLVVFVVASVGVLAVKGQALLLASLGLVPRYTAELAPLFVLCAAGALTGVTISGVDPGARLRLSAARVEALASAALAVVIIASAAVSTAFLAPNLEHRDEKAYVQALRGDLREHPQVVLLDGGVPDRVISSWYTTRATVSRVVGYAPENPVFDLPSHALRMVREDGHLSTIVLDGAVPSAPSEDPECGYPVRGEGTRVPMAAEVPFGRWVLRIGYYTNADGFMSVDVAGGQQRFAVRHGLNVVDLVVVGTFDGFDATLESQDSALCLTDASAGTPRPETP
jgi:hypothetical protein